MTLWKADADLALDQIRHQHDEIESVGAQLRDALLTLNAIRDVLVDDEGEWRELNSCADAIQDISLILSAAKFN